MTPSDSAGPVPTTSPRITREDIESKLRELEGEVTDVQDEVVNVAVTVGAVVVVVVVVVAFWLGRRRGNSTRTVVEVRRV